ncbi:hypothetical protein B0J14DRAFT_51279 [Halenospora varia]|nr:hypothetical protein B0J14DRAFT_51279 [Halenospora varia]
MASRALHPVPIRSQSEQLPGFHLFPLLPTELRIQIWSHALNIPRTLTIRGKRGSKNTYGEGSRSSVIRYFSCQEAAPAVLYANQESRTFALTILEPSFTASWYLTSRYTYVNWSIDTLRLNAHDMDLHCSGRGISGARKLVLDVVSQQNFFSYVLKGCFKDLHMLQEVHVISTDLDELRSPWATDNMFSVDAPFIEQHVTEIQDQLQLDFGLGKVDGWICPSVSFEYDYPNGLLQLL